VRLVVDRVPVARKVLAKRGFTVEETELLEVELADKPGTLAQLAGALGQAGVDISHVFAGAAGARKAKVFLAVSDLAKASKVAARALR